MKTVFVGLSGGVDSAVSAYLLKKEGYKVVGVFLKVWEPDFLPCTSGQDRLDAMRVAAHLEIPFLSYDLEEEYKKSVVDYFVEEYRAGRTPNPDVMCNREIKFGAFWERAKKDGADCIATGHYARNVEGKLLRGIDESKDQSYFLWTLTKDDLSHSLFPVGELKKKEVRRIADSISLPNAVKKDSQGLCFLGHVDMREFLMHYLPVQKGPVMVGEKAVGEHDGAWFYTIGERFPVGGQEKMYIVGKDIETNTLSVSHILLDLRNRVEVGASGRDVAELSRINWIREKPEPRRAYEAQVRYHGEKLPCTVEGSTVRFETPVLIAEGQSVVIYNPENGECIGGGVA